MLYFKREWKDTRGDQYDSWGTCTFFFETEDDGLPLRHNEVYENGNTLRYSEQNLEDEFGMLANNKLFLKQFEPFKIDQNDFMEVWFESENELKDVDFEEE
jgi:hypothetical protein